MKRGIAIALPILCLVIVLAYYIQHLKSKEQTATEPRPVVTITAQLTKQRQTSFTGTIQPRYQTEVGFQVLGQIIAFNVKAGDTVKKGQVLVELDPTQLDLAKQSSQSDLIKMQSALNNAQADQARISMLHKEKVESQETLDAADQVYKSATASVKEYAGKLEKAQENRNYATLVSDTDGVVVAKYADVGQTVAVAQKVLTLARTDFLEAVVDLPEDVSGALSPEASFLIILQSDPSVKVLSQVREISPQADAATRTHRVRLALGETPVDLRIGTTISALAVSPPGNEDDTLTIPASALFERHGISYVWVIAQGGHKVNAKAVKVIRHDGDNVMVVPSDIKNARIVRAGVNSLSEGQEVRIEESLTDE